MEVSRLTDLSTKRLRYIYSTNRIGCSRVSVIIYDNCDTRISGLLCCFMCDFLCKQKCVQPLLYLSYLKLFVLLDFFIEELYVVNESLI